MKFGAFHKAGQTHFTKRTPYMFVGRRPSQGETIFFQTDTKLNEMIIQISRLNNKVILFKNQPKQIEMKNYKNRSKKIGAQYSETNSPVLTL